MRTRRGYIWIQGSRKRNRKLLFRVHGFMALGFGVKPEF